MEIQNSSRFFFLLDHLRYYTDQIKIVDRENPFAIEMDRQKYSVHVSSIHDSGEGRADDDELRIQIRRPVIDRQRERQGQGFHALFIGFFSDGDVFSAWEPDYAFSQRAEITGSVYARLSHQAMVSAIGAAVRKVAARNLGRPTYTISTRSEYLGFYLQNYADLHKARNSDELAAALVPVLGALEVPEASVETQAEVDLGGERRTVTVTRTAYARDPKFSKAVLEAYGHACCVCGRGLGLVQAAHIIPHSHAASNNLVTNGLALCVMHHKLYDDALLLPGPGQTLILNAERVEHLKNIGQWLKAAEVEDLENKLYGMPADADHQPDEDALAHGVRIRLGLGD